MGAAVFETTAFSTSIPHPSTDSNPSCSHTWGGVEDGPSAWVVATYLRDAGGIPVPELAPAILASWGAKKWIEKKKKKEDRRLLLSLSLLF